MRKSFSVCLYLLVIFMLAAVGCGGGGGDGGGGAPAVTGYTGTWQFDSNQALNECRLDLPTRFSTQPKVSHTGNDVVVISGQETLTGKTHDRDGFAVFSPVRTSSNGCQSMTGYRFENASDGTADARWAVEVNCGSLSCLVVYDGVAVRTSLSTALVVQDMQDNQIEELANACAKQMPTPTAKTEVDEEQMKSNLIKALEVKK